MAGPLDANAAPQAASGYMTPSQVKAVQDYAKFLSEGGHRQPEVHHWTQGVSNMLGALVGRRMSQQAGEEEKRGYASAASALPNAPGGPSPEGGLQPTKTSADDSDTPPVREVSYNLVNGAGANPNIDRSKSVIGGMESGNHYDAEGPVIASGPMKGQKAIGRYQVMESNIAPWTKAHLGREMTAEEFKSTPAAQDAVFKGEFGRLSDKYGPQGAAKAWFAGEGGMNNPQARDQLGTTVAGYGDRFSKGMGNTAMAFNGVEAPSPAAAITAKVLSKGAGGSPMTGPGAVPAIPGGLDPRLVPHRPQITRQQYEAVMRNPWIDPAMKQQTNQMYMEQFNPQRLPTTGGTLVTTPDGRTQQYIPDQNKGNVKAGDIDVPAAQQWNPATRRYELYPAEEPPKPPGPRSDAAPAPGAPPVPGAPVIPTSQTAGVDETKVPGLPGKAPAAPAGAQVASLDPSIGIGKPPGEGGVDPVAAALTAPPGTEAPIKVAENVDRMNVNPPSGKPPLIPQSVWDADKAMKERKIETEGLMEGTKEMAKANVKHYQDATLAAQQTRDKLPLLDAAQKLTEDPNFYTGFMNGPVLEWQRLKSGIAASPFGNLLSPEQQKEWSESARPNEMFRKIVSGSILDGMKSTLQGLGQVRVAEIRLLEQANAAPANTVASNKALIAISRRQAQRQVMYDNIMQDYVSGSEVVDPMDPSKVLAPANNKNGEITERVPDSKMRGLMRKFSELHPAFTPEETSNFERIFKEDKEAKAPESGAKPEKAKTIQQGGFTYELQPDGSYK